MLISVCFRTNLDTEKRRKTPPRGDEMKLVPSFPG